MYTDLYVSVRTCYYRSLHTQQFMLYPSLLPPGCSVVFNKLLYKLMASIPILVMSEPG